MSPTSYQTTSTPGSGQPPLFLVPIANASGLILFSAAHFVRDDIESVRAECVTHAATFAAA